MLPDDEYLLQLGRVTYALSLLESVVRAELRQLPGLPAALAERKLAGKSIEALARAMTDPTNTGRVADPTTRDWLLGAGAELAAAARLHHAITHARAAGPGEEPRLHRRPDEQRDAVDITSTWLERARTDLDEALHQIPRLRTRAA
ncbi:hypothetical protein [Embleya sp. AB8]|uniref:hypothetical protein n=1 Tax=Embleya sp. AB8 TaxID=3156304 RepID=UPI003C7961F8